MCEAIKEDGMPVDSSKNVLETLELKSKGLQFLNSNKAFATDSQQIIDT